MPDSEPLVSVVIPAYNASQTLSATLDSVRSQTHAALDIIVVDDGSTDDTAAIAEDFRRRDNRIRVLRTANGGVARARNAGIAAARSDIVALVDADDLWHSTKIAKQLAALNAGGPNMAFVYALFRRVDETGAVLLDQRYGGVSGSMFHELLITNYVGNGSSVMMRRDCIMAVGGYDATMRDRGRQGAEDWLSQLLMARRWTVGCVPEFLVGYRRSAGAMSSDAVRIERARLAALDRLVELLPHVDARMVARARSVIHGAIARIFVQRREVAPALRAYWDALSSAPFVAIFRFLQVAPRIIARLAGLRDQRRRLCAGLPFLEVDPRFGADRPARDPLCRFAVRRNPQPTGAAGEPIESLCADC